MTHPFFSIIMPTKNRSEILGESIESALRQSFGDFELIISDNDDSAEATTKVISRYDDRRIKHLRTSGTLPMHENWENAFNHARGDYVLVLEDKMRLVTNTLEILHHYLCLYPGTVISYSVKFATGSTIPTPKLFPAAHQQDSKKVIERFCQFSQSFFDLVPKGLDSCASRELLKRAQAASPTGFLFSYICPDYSYGFLLLSQVDSFLHIREPLVFVPNNWMWQGRYSNGQSSYKKDSHIRRFLSELPVKMEDVLKLVPIKSECLWINSVVFDFLTKYKRRGHQPQINWIAYHGFCIILVLLGKKIGGDMRLEIAEIKRALKHHDLGFRGRVALDVLWRGFALGWQAIKGQVKQITRN